MIALLITMGSMLAYLAIGFGVAAWDMPSLHRRVAEEYTSSWQRRARVARAFAITFAVFWPFCAPYLVMTRLTDKHNPELITRELRRREQALADRELEIMRLERKLKVGQQEAIVPMSYLPPERPDSLGGRFWKNIYDRRKDDHCT